jgi:hypothetical protein
MLEAGAVELPSGREGCARWAIFPGCCGGGYLQRFRRGAGEVLRFLTHHDRGARESEDCAKHSGEKSGERTPQPRPACLASRVCRNDLGEVVLRGNQRLGSCRVC